MDQVLFDCPQCHFSKEIQQNDIPPAATKCACPKCKTESLLSEAIKSIQKDDNLQNQHQETTADLADPSVKNVDSNNNFYQKFDEALEALNTDNDLEALMLLQDLDKEHKTPIVGSYLAYCRAKVKHDFSDAIRVCKQALKEQPSVADHYLNLGRIYLLVNKRGPALKLFRKGAKFGQNSKLMYELRKFEKRKTPVFPSLSRDHVLNRQLGKMFSRLKLR